ncbi:response regulator transcription factor [Trinickia violacea]|uniref:Response regulator transcription factor n=1 Tax=Trinickia violacea TaxID=2571746 RepID=A0A4P8J2M1_9BURK|nr:response regulator transcription factor [Trinickia violacea]QCP54363.1 response regulator transcription factor [Trinickia violacea]
MRIAILEDEVTQMEYLVHALEQHFASSADGLSCVCFGLGESLRGALRSETFDLLVLDWNVPDLDGLDLLRWVREYRESQVPVIVLSSRGSECDVAAALATGADDYLIKPLRPLELAARIQNLLRKQQPQTQQRAIERFGYWEFDRASSTARLSHPSNCCEVELTAREFRLALALFGNLGQTVSRGYLMERMGTSGESLSRSLDSQIYRLRTKLGLRPAHGVRLQTIYGKGYRLEVFDKDA